MRFYIVFLILTISSSVVAQKRATIFKEIHSYRDSIYNKTPYQTDSLDFSKTVDSYFKKNKFTKIRSETIFPVSYQIKTKLSCDDHNYSKSKYDCYIIASVLVSIIDLKGLYIEVKTSTERYNEPFMMYSSTERILGQYKFDETALKEHLYVYYYGSKPNLPAALLAKIEKYNGKQKQEEKKIIEGRNY